MKLRWLVAAVVAQVLLLAFMAGQREWVLHTGRVIVLRTAPLDPDDPMRGAYVRLDFELNRVPAELCRGEVRTWLKNHDEEARPARDRVVYAELKTMPWGTVAVASLSDTPPASGLYLRGRVQHLETDAVTVRYGVEAIFLNKEAARAMETASRTSKAGAPLEVRVAVSDGGLGVMQSYQWEPLGLTLAFDRADSPPPDPNLRNAPRTIVGLTATLHNYSDHDVAVVDLPGAASFRLIRNERGFDIDRYAWDEPAASAAAAPQAADVAVLKPGASRAVRIDLRDARWRLRERKIPNAAPIAFTDADRSGFAPFRLEYRPPLPAAAAALPHAELIQLRPVVSRGFGPSAGVD